jgi:hypothetical protein
MLKIVNWNINGGFLISENKTFKNLDFFVNKIKSYSPDIVLIQEGHISKDLNQVEYLSKELGLNYYSYYILGDSHIEKESKLCLFILSKFEILSSDFFEITNPNLVGFNQKYGGEISTENFIKGFLQVNLIFLGKSLNLVCGHAHAFYIFGKSYDDFPELVNEIKNYILSKSLDSSLILGADFNYGLVWKNYFDVFNKGINCVFKNEKTLRDVQLDYILLSSDLEVLNKYIDNCSDDHSLLYCEIDIE